jgi:site-specific DNA recombinase
VSTAIQVDGYSLKAQEDRLRKEAKHRGYKVIGVYPDEGKSGKDIKDREKFNEMIEDIRSGKKKLNYVCVFKLSRFGRNAADTLSSLQLLEDYGVSLLCVEDGIDSAGAAGKLLIAVYAAVAEAERENIHAQTMAG